MGRNLRWPEGAQVTRTPFPGGAMLSDPRLIGNDWGPIESGGKSWFEREWWAGRATVHASAEGRGSVSFIEAPNRSLVLRHYRRGGLAARVSRDRYVFSGFEATRAWREWHLLYLMRLAGLPVPAPVAASVRRVGSRLYTADLLTERVGGAPSLASRLRVAPLPFSGWLAMGRCLRRFHVEGVYHADLNASNILLTDAFDVWLVDFDRARLRRPGLWCDENLVRLRRSIEKLVSRLPAERFSDNDWASLLGGYFAAARDPAA